MTQRQYTYYCGTEICLWNLLQIRKSTNVVSVIPYCVPILTAPNWGLYEGKLGDCGSDLMLAPCPQLQASGPLPFTFCPGNEAGCLDTFGRQMLHMGCGQRVYVCVLKDSGP